MQDTMKMNPEMEKLIKEAPVTTLLGLLAFANMLDGVAKVAASTPAPEAPEPAAPAMTPTMAEFKAIEDKARTDLYALMDMSFADGGSVFLYDLPTGGCWSYDIDRQYSDKPHTVAVVRDVIGKKSTGVSVLNPPDAFNAVIGRAIALRRAMDKPVPKDYYTAGALLARATAKPSEPITPAPITKSFKVGDVVSFTGRTASPSTSAGAVTPGNTYKITRMERDGASIQLDGKTCGWVSPVDLVHAPIVEAPTAEIKAGDYVRALTDNAYASDTLKGRIYKVAEVTPSDHERLRLDIPSCPYIRTDAVERVRFVKRKARAGDTIRINTTGAYKADVKEGDFFTVTGTSNVGNAITGANVNTGEKDGWYIPDEYYEVVEAVNASQPSADTATPDPHNGIKVGDKVRHMTRGKEYTVKKLCTCACGKPAVEVEGLYLSMHVENLEKVEDAKPVEKPAEKWVMKEAQVGDTIRRPVGRVWSDTKPYVVKSIGTCRCGARILNLEGSTDTPHPGNYEVLEVEKSAPAPAPEKWVRRTANVGDTIRVLMDRPEGAMPVKKGDRFKVQTSYGPHCIVTDGDGWHFSSMSYEVLDV